MKRPAAHPSRFGPRTSVAAALALSVLGHGLFGAVVNEAMQLPDLGIALSLPSEVELGLAEPVSAPAPVAPPPAAAAPEAPAKRPGGRPDAAVADAGEADAGLTDAGTKHAPGTDAGPAIAQSTLPPRLPEGTQIAVRVDIARIRASAVADDVRGLLAAIPDFRALLHGSGIDPVTELDRLLIASPNLSREKAVIAGRFVGGRAVVEAAVARLAEAHDTAAPWGQTLGVPTAPWASDDPTPRLVAIVGPQHFAITRPEDLARVLAIAAARGAKRKDKRAPAQPPAEALLSMEPGEGLSLEVEGVARFVRAGRLGIPTTLRLSASELPGQRVLVRAHLAYPGAEEAASAAEFWDRARANYARNPLVVLLGLGGPLADAHIAPHGSDVDAELTLELDQTRLILGYVRELVAPPSTAPRPGAP